MPELTGDDKPAFPRRVALTVCPAIPCPVTDFEEAVPELFDPGVLTILLVLPVSPAADDAVEDVSTVNFGRFLRLYGSSSSLSSCDFRFHDGSRFLVAYGLVV